MGGRGGGGVGYRSGVNMGDEGMGWAKGVGSGTGLKGGGYGRMGGERKRVEKRLAFSPYNLNIIKTIAVVVG